MSNATALIPELYELYKNAGPSLPLILCSVSLCLVGFAGISMNLGVIFVTARSRNLHGTANFLLALTSFFEVLHQPVHLLFLYITLSGHNFMNLGMAIIFVLPSQFALGGVTAAMLATGIDRLLCIIFAFQIKMVRKRWIRLYLAILTLLCFVNGLYGTQSLLKTAKQLPKLQVTGSIEDVILSDTDSHMMLAMGISLLTILIYVLVGMFIRFCQPASSVQQPSNNPTLHHRIYRSLLCIVLVNIGGYFFAGLFTMCLIQFRVSAVTMWFVSQALTVLVNISAASNGPILWATSSEYQKVFKRELALFYKKFCWKSSSPVHPFTIPQHT